jgi:ribosome-binding factor A
MSKRSYPRTYRLNSLLQQEIAQWLHKEWDYEDREGITVTRVEISGDGSYAKIYFLPQEKVENPENLEKIEEELKKTIPALTTYLFKTLHIRKVPRIHFLYDQPYAKGSQTLLLMKKIHMSKQEEKKEKPHQG